MRAFAAVLSFLILFGLGMAVGREIERQHLPNCAEDEVLTWKPGQYHGPEEFGAQDLRCVHIENLSETP